MGKPRIRAGATMRLLGGVTLALAVLGGLALGSGQALASHVSCGDTITTGTTLDSDLVSCPNNGILIGADDVTLDLNGHTIDGDGELKEDCAEDDPCDLGVFADGHNGVTIEHGTIREFALGVLVLDARHNRLRDLSVSENLFSGVIIAESARTEMERSAVFANGLTTDQAGVGVFDSDDGLISRNRVSRNGDIGFFVVDADDYSFLRNRLSGNPEAGMLMEDLDGNKIDRNRLTRNGEGITVAGDQNEITRNHVSDSRAGLEGGGLGIFVAAGHDNVVERNIITRASRSGIRVSLLPEELGGDTPATDTVVRLNHLRRNEDGVFVETTAEDTLLEGNHAVGSEDDGFDVDSPDTTLTRNHAVHSADLGIEAVRGVIDGGGNVARHNGDPRQCTNIVCN
jgi:parallel beta-helix repeat protein